jgi:hypothetical protein
VGPAGSGLGPVAGYREYGDEPAGSGATELVSNLVSNFTFLLPSAFQSRAISSFKCRPSFCDKSVRSVHFC